MDQADRKKSMLLMFMVILVAIVAVVGISFALYDVVVDDSKVGTIVTGKFSVNYDTYDGYCTDISYFDQESCLGGKKEWINTSSSLNIKGAYPVSDIVGASSTNTNSIVSFGVSSDDADISYAISFSDYVFGDTLNQDYIKINLLKNGEYILGSSTSGVLISDLNKDELNNYIINKSSVLKGDKDIYVLRAWIDQNYVPNYEEEIVENRKIISVKQEEVSFKIKIEAYNK